MVVHPKIFDDGELVEDSAIKKLNFIGKILENLPI